MLDLKSWFSYSTTSIESDDAEEKADEMNEWMNQEKKNKIYNKPIDNTKISFWLFSRLHFSASSLFLLNAEMFVIQFHVNSNKII